jgi:hypothetical protein
MLSCSVTLSTLSTKSIQGPDTSWRVAAGGFLTGLFSHLLALLGLSVVGGLALLGIVGKRNTLARVVAADIRFIDPKARMALSCL